MNEIVPLLSGATLGCLVGGLRPRKRLVVVALLSIPLGIGASAVTGELSVGWEFILVDIPLVALSAAASVAAVGRRHVPVRRPLARRRDG